MKKLTLVVLAMALSFGAFAQNLKIADLSGAKAPFKALTHMYKTADAVSQLKTPSMTLDLQLVTPETDSGFNASCTITVGENTSWMATIVNASAASQISDEYLIAYFEEYNQYYQQYGYDFYMSASDAGTYSFTGLDGNKSYIAMGVAIDGTDTIVVRSSSITTPSSSLSGTATVEISGEYSADDDAAILSATFGSQTRVAEYWLQMVSTDESLGFSGEAADVEDFWSTLESNYSSYIDELSSDLDETAVDMSSVDEGDGVDFIVMPYNGNGEAGSFGFVRIMKGDNVSISEVLAGMTSVYPNPATENVTVNSASKINSVELYNALGQRVYAADVNAASATISVAGMENGTYFVKAYTDSAVYTNKVIVK